VTRAIELRLPPTKEAPANARRALDQLESAVSSDVLDDVRLLVSELVTNSIRHAELSPNQWVWLSVSVEGGTIRVEVIDPGPGFRPDIPRPTLYQESGWGLYLVEQVANRWGVIDDGTIHVWFEIDRSTRSGGSKAKEPERS
jgi:anti-sigma regulatory factor (Ser/Thr protein kinase)